MRAKFINEKFEHESDPIKDMGIGKIDFSEIHMEIFSPAQMEWDERLGEMLYGKTIIGVMKMLYTGHTGLQGTQYTPGLQGPTGTQRRPLVGGTIGKYKVKVKDYQGDLCTGNIQIKGEDGTAYELLTGDQEYIIE